MSATPPVLRARELGRRLGGKWALKSVDLEVAPGRLVMVIGHNGAGKTTLVRVLSTALAPSRGTLELFGRPAGYEVRPRVGMLSHADGHYDDLTARENLDLAVRLGSGRGADAGAILERVGLGGRGGDLVRSFSAGMRKRLAFARLLARAPELVLLDEPYAQLDPAGHTFVDGLLTELRAAGRTVVVSTHQVARARALCDDAVLLADGRVQWTGPAARLPDAGSPPAEDAVS